MWICGAHRWSSKVIWNLNVVEVLKVKSVLTPEKFFKNWKVRDDNQIQPKFLEELELFVIKSCTRFCSWSVAIFFIFFPFPTTFEG